MPGGSRGSAKESGDRALASGGTPARAHTAASTLRWLSVTFGERPRSTSVPRNLIASASAIRDLCSPSAR